MSDTSVPCESPAAAAETGEPDAAIQDKLVESAVTSILPESDTHKLEESFLDMECAVDVILPGTFHCQPHVALNTITHVLCPLFLTDYAAGPVKSSPALMEAEALYEMSDCSTDSDVGGSSITISNGRAAKDLFFTSPESCGKSEIEFIHSHH